MVSLMVAIWLPVTIEIPPWWSVADAERQNDKKNLHNKTKRYCSCAHQEQKVTQQGHGGSTTKHLKPQHIKSNRAAQRTVP